MLVQAALDGVQEWAVMAVVLLLPLLAGPLDHHARGLEARLGEIANLLIDT